MPSEETDDFGEDLNEFQSELADLVRDFHGDAPFLTWLRTAQDTILIASVPMEAARAMETAQEMSLRLTSLPKASQQVLEAFKEIFRLIEADPRVGRVAHEDLGVEDPEPS